MRRRAWLLLPLLALDCRSRPPAAGALLPENLAGDWHRGEIRELPPESVPPEVAHATLRQALEAMYEGPAFVQVDLFVLSSSAAGLDLAQRWRPAADTVFFYQGNYFVVVRWRNFDRQRLTVFLRALQRHLASFAK